jgi:hypothetical protein
MNKTNSHRKRLIKLGVQFTCAMAAAAIMKAATLSAASAAESRIVFTEAFDGLGNQPVGFTAACAIHEAPPSLKSLAFRPLVGKPAEVYKGFFVVPNRGAAIENFEFRFRFAFPRDSKKAFTVSLVCGDAADKKSQTTSVITISEKSMGIRPPAAGLLPPFGGSDQELDLRLMPDGLWHNALVRCSGRTLELFVENDGVLRQFAQAEVPGAPFIGFNFAGATAVDFDDIEIRRIDPAPAGDFRMEGGVKTALQAAEHTMKIPANVSAVSASFRIGTYPGAIALKLGHADGTERVIDVRTVGSFYDKSVVRSVNELSPDGKLVAVLKPLKEHMNLRDAGLLFKERSSVDPKLAWSLNYHSRPNLRSRYTPDRELHIASTWEMFPAASQRFVQFELRPDELGQQVWIDGRYAGRFDNASKLTSLSFVLPAKGAIKDEVIATKPFSGKYLALDVSKIANPGAMADVKISVGGKPGGAQEVSGIPMLVSDGPGNADTGVCREGLGSFFLECDGYLSRTPFDGMPENLLFGVPVAQYHRAWVLCAVEDDPDKVPVLTARLTKFLPGAESGRGPAIADTVVTLPRTGEALPAGVKKVGEVKSGGKTLPLYLAEIRIDSGSIQEIMFQEKPVWLDFEVLGKRNDKDNFYVDRSRKPSEDISGVHVFAATLERPPVEMHIMPTVFGNIYQPNEKPAMTATLHAREKTSATLAWTVRDLHGKTLEQGSKALAFTKSGDVVKMDIPFAQRDLGWYGVDFQLSGADKTELLKHSACFALIDSDKRKAGYDSPYFTWNFGGAHGTIKDINISGPLMLKAGIRSTHVESEEVGAPWKLTKAQISRLNLRSKDPQAIDLELEKLIKEQVAKFPHASMVLIFHESGGGPFPLELVGGKTEVDEKQRAYDQGKAAHLDLMAKAYRKHAPQIKLVVGNSGGANTGLLAALYRAKVPRDQIDFIGEETVGMTMPPEVSVGRENWVNQEVARIFGYGDIPISACYEWKSRRSRHLGLERHAEWNVRDVLIGHAWKQPLIPTFALPDVSNSYYNSVWGDGAFTHNPQVYPKPTYPAVATVTKVLDCARFERMIPTGSLSVYALEFKRDKEFVYAFWTARGELDATLDFEKDGAVNHTELLGRTTEQKVSGGKLVLHIAEGAVYLTSSVTLKTIASLGERTFPREQLPSNAQPIVASKMDRPAEWKLDLSVDHRLDVPAKAPVTSTSFRRPGKYELREVKDDQHGECLELELIKDGECPALMQEYTFLRLEKPIALPGTPATVALQVKGNSSWGKVFWEIEDAEGERWLSAGTGGYGCDVYDWPEQAGLNFDGWNNLQFPITAKSPISVQSPGQDAWQWQRSGSGNGKIDYPIKLTGIAISMPRQAVNLIKMEPVKTSIRLGGLSAY